MDSLNNNNSPSCIETAMESSPKQQCSTPTYTYTSDSNGQPQININVSNMNSANAFSLPMLSDKNRWLAFLLCLFLGWFGIHRFYLGKPLTGIIYIFTGGLFCIGWIYDGVNLLLNNAKDGNGFPLR